MNARARGVRRVGVDTGGTFTDLVVVGRRGIESVLKVRSTPDDPSRAVREGLRRLGLLEADLPVIHGTTVATNAFLQRRGGRTALVSTRGFEDVLVLGRQARPFLYRLDPPARIDWIPRSRRVGLPGRIGPEGEVWRPLPPRALARLARRLRRLRVEAVAVCLLHAYANPSHERAVGRALRGGGWHLSLSHRVAGEFREFERTCTTVANATLAAPLGTYLRRLERDLGGRLKVMASSGGWITARRAADQPVRTLLSGPAGGAVAAARLGRATGHPDLITLDMGGTSTDLSVCEGEVGRASTTVLDGVSLNVPGLAIRSVGAGGGSIARIDAGGALRVGPESAGAEPGPACYGRGGDEPTVTDAHLVLGRLPREGLLGGSVPLREDLARSAVGRLGRRLGLSVARTALGILGVADAGLERAVRAATAERGRDPAGYALLVFGGAGGLHACGVARRLGIRTVLVPRDPGAFSALGLCASPATWESSRTVLLRRRRFTPGEVRERLSGMEAAGIRTLLAEGHARSSIRIEREADLRYAGQSHEITLPVTADLAGSFHRRHLREFGYHRPGEGMELVTLRVRVSAPAPAIPAVRPAAPTHGETAPSRSPAIGANGRRIPLSVWERRALAPGRLRRGPLLVCEYSATTFVDEGFTLERAPEGHLILRDTRGARR